MSESLTLEEVIGFLLDAKMFGDLDPSELSQIVHIMQIQSLRDGQHVFQEGDAGEAWYVVFKGNVSVLKESDMTVRNIATLGPRSCFGEMAILDGQRRSATVKAKGDVTIFRFPKDGFEKLMEQGNLASYKLIHQMAKVLVSRQRDITVKLVGLMEESKDGEVRKGLSPIIDKSSVTE